MLTMIIQVKKWTAHISRRSRRFAPISAALIVLLCWLAVLVSSSEAVPNILQDSTSTWSESNEQRSSRSRRHCPSCQLAGQERPEQPQQPQQRQTTQSTVGDTARLESIKRQILVKLGLNSKPNLLSTIPPRDFILETLLRAEESTVSSPSSSKNQHNHHSASADSSREENAAVEDDFYGKTSEIIAFGEPGPRLNGQVLAEFSRVQETAPEPSLRVKSATLWIYVQLRSSSNDGWTQPKSRHHRHYQPDRLPSVANRRPPTLYVFRLLSQQHNTNFSLLDKNWNELLASQRVTIQHSGWMKINVTEGVQKWFSTSSSSPSSKLQLLVDCSGCGSSVEPVLFSSSTPASSSSSSSNQKQKKKKKRRRRRRRRRLAVDEDEEEDEENDKRTRQQHRPFIVIHTDSSSSRRLRRRTPLDCSPTTSACCKQRFFVSFRALGWDDWIIAPSGYYANYCRGDCGGGPSGSSRTPDTFLSYHSHVIDEVRKLPFHHQQINTNTNNRRENNTGQQEDEERQQQLMKQQQLYASLQPCCAPTKFSSMSLIYFGPDMNIIKRDLPKMVVDECGCP